MEEDKKDYEIVYENDIFIGEKGDLAKTSPLLECAGLFIYSNIDNKGILAHWESRENLVEKIDIALKELKLNNSYSIIVGCGLPVECLSYSDSKTYCEVKEFLTKKKILIRDELVGFDKILELQVNFSNGFYQINLLKMMK